MSQETGAKLCTGKKEQQDRQEFEKRYFSSFLPGNIEHTLHY